MLRKETVLSGAKHPGTDPKIMRSTAGYYIGFEDTDGSPYSRETHYMELGFTQIALAHVRKALADPVYIRLSRFIRS